MLEVITVTAIAALAILTLVLLGLEWYRSDGYNLDRHIDRVLDDEVGDR